MDTVDKLRKALTMEALSFPLERFVKRDGSINRAKLRQLEPDFQQDALNFIFIRKAIDVHGIFFGYEQSVYKGMQLLVKVWCPDHEDYFTQSAKSHLAGYGCKHCASRVINRITPYGSFEVPCPLHKFSIDGDHIIWYNKFNKLRLPLENQDEAILERT